MTTFYAVLQNTKGVSHSVTLNETLYHKAQNEAEDIAKQAGMKVEFIRTFANKGKQPGVLSKGNIQRETGSYRKF